MSRKQPPPIPPDDDIFFMEQCVHDAELVLSIAHSQIPSEERVITSLAVAFTTLAKARGARFEDLVPVIALIYQDFSIQEGRPRYVN